MEELKFKLGFRSKDRSKGKSKSKGPEDSNYGRDTVFSAQGAAAQDAQGREDIVRMGVGQGLTHGGISWTPTNGLAFTLWSSGAFRSH